MPITKLEDLKPDPRNANRGTPRGHSIIERSVRERGAGRSGLAAADGTMIAGSQTLQKMAELGMKIKPVHTSGDEWVVVIRDDIAPGSEEATLLALEDNRSSEVGLEWEPDVLAAIAREFDVSALFTVDELAEVALPGLQEPQDDPPVSIDETKPTRCQAGDVWRVGRHTVACVDSTDRATVARLIAGRKVGMVVADPPYGIDIVAADVSVGGGEKYDYPFGGVGAAARPRLGYVGGGQRHKDKTGKYYIEEKAPKRLGTSHGSKPFGSRRDHVVGTIGGDNMIPAGRYMPVIGDDSIDTAVKASTLALELLPVATHFWWGANNYANTLPPSTCWIVWDKQNTGNFADAELAWSNHKSAVRIFQHMWNGLMKQSERGVARVHPTQKPIALFDWLFQKYGAPGDLIFDPFLGSGPSIKAAEPLGRTVIGCELSPHYVDHVLEWAEQNGLEVELVPAG